MDKLYSCKKAAEILDVSPYTLKKKLRSGEYKGVRIGNRWKLSESTLNELTSAKKLNSNDDPTSIGMSSEMEKSITAAVTATFPDSTEDQINTVITQVKNFNVSEDDNGKKN